MISNDSIKPSTALTIFNLGTGIVLGATLLYLDSKIKERNSVSSKNALLSVGIVALAGIISVGLISSDS